MTPELAREWVTVPVPEDGEAPSMPVYVARPANAGRYPNVILGFEMFGVTQYVRDVADRVAGLGYTTLAPDFYHRFGERIDLPVTAEGRARGLDLLQSMDRAGVRRDMRALLAYLRDRAGSSTPTAMLGLSVGGHLAYYSATQFPLAALAVFYPGWLTDPGIALGRPEPTLALTHRIAQFGTPVLFMVGDGDHLFTAERRDEIAERLRESGVKHEMIVYPDTPHGFFCHERDTYRPAAADDAFARVRALFAAQMRPEP